MIIRIKNKVFRHFSCLFICFSSIHIRTNLKKEKKEKLSKRTYRISLFFTLSNIKTNSSPNLLTIEQVANLILNEFGEGKIIISTESHSSQDDFHFHGCLILDSGIRKNTFHSQFDNLFPSFAFGNCTNIRGVRRIKNTITYISKCISIKRLISLFKDGIPPFEIYSNFNPYNLKKFLTLNVKELESVEIIVSILEYEDITDWIKTNLHFLTFSTRNKNSATLLWNISRTFRQKESLALPILKHAESIDVNETIRSFYNEIEINWIEIRCLQHLIIIVLWREGELIDPPTPIIPKTPGIIIVGHPNTGKTRIINKVSQVFNSKNLFFKRTANKVADFTSFDSLQIPIIVLDDILRTVNHESSLLPFLLKLLAGELEKGDVKYGRILTNISYSGVVIISNYWELFSEVNALNRRTKRYLFRRLTPFRWWEVDNNRIYSFLAALTATNKEIYHLHVNRPKGTPISETQFTSLTYHEEKKRFYIDTLPRDFILLNHWSGREYNKKKEFPNNNYLESDEEDDIIF